LFYCCCKKIPCRFFDPARGVVHISLSILNRNITPLPTGLLFAQQQQQQAAAGVEAVYVENKIMLVHFFFRLLELKRPFQS